MTEACWLAERERVCCRS